VPDYRKYCIGALIVLIGTQMQSVALQWEIYERTEEAIYLGLIGLVQIIPAILFLLPSGHIADTYDRRRVVALGMVGTTLTSIGLYVASIMVAPVYVIFILLFFDAVFLVLARPARAAMMPLIVPEKIFGNAVAWNTSLFQVALMAGPALGGVVVGLYLPAAFIISAVASATFAVLILMITIPKNTAKREPLSIERLLSGAKFVKDSKLVLGAVGLDMFAVLLGGATYLLPIYAKDILHVDERGFGLLRAAPAVGAFAMAILLAHRPPMQRAGRNLLWAVAGFGLATIAFGLSEWFWLSFVMLMMTGVTDNISMVIRHTLVQLATPNEMRGRVSAINSVFIGVSNEMGGFESGFVAQYFGPIVSVVSGGIGTLFVVAATAIGFPQLRKLGRLEDVAPGKVNESR